jgi:DNA-binding transcriptional LysR family regulator
VPNVALEVETIETAKRMVERGLGLAFLPHLAVAREIRQATLVAVELTDAEALSRSLDLIHPRHRPLTPEALGFLDALRAGVRELEAPGRRKPPRAARRARR